MSAGAACKADMKPRKTQEFRATEFRRFAANPPRDMVDRAKGRVSLQRM